VDVIFIDGILGVVEAGQVLPIVSDAIAGPQDPVLIRWCAVLEVEGALPLRLGAVAEDAFQTHSRFSSPSSPVIMPGPGWCL
jgi:hypothetical protein